MNTVNIWSLNKHSSIKHFLLLLQHELGCQVFDLLDIETLDHRAVRIGSQNTPATAYLYTYGQVSQQYGLHLEYPDNGESNTVDQQAIFDELSCDQLITTLVSHLELGEQAGGYYQ